MNRRETPTFNADDVEMALNGLIGTTRAVGSDRVLVQFTDEAWEAAKRVLIAAREALRETA